MSEDIMSYHTFLEELQDLANFRLEYSLDNPDALLEAEVIKEKIFFLEHDLWEL